MFQFLAQDERVPPVDETESSEGACQHNERVSAECYTTRIVHHRFRCCLLCWTIDDGNLVTISVGLPPCTTRTQVDLTANHRGRALA